MVQQWNMLNSNQLPPIGPAKQNINSSYQPTISNGKQYVTDQIYHAFKQQLLLSVEMKIWTGKRADATFFLMLSEPETKHLNEKQNKNQKKPKPYGSWIDATEKSGKKETKTKIIRH